MPDRVTGIINNCHNQNSFLSTLRLFSVSSSCRAYTQGKDLFPTVPQLFWMAEQALKTFNKVLSRQITLVA